MVKLIKVKYLQRVTSDKGNSIGVVSIANDEWDKLKCYEDDKDGQYHLYLTLTDGEVLSCEEEGN